MSFKLVDKKLFSKFKALSLTLSFIALLSATALFPATANAQTDSVNINEAWDGSCNGTATVNNTSSTYAYYNSGDTANLQIANASSNTLSVSISEPGQTTQNITLSPDGGQTVPYPLTTQLLVSASVEADGSSSNCSGSNTTYVYVFGASGSLTCSVSDSKVWNVTGSYNYVNTYVTMYRGSTYVATITDDKGGPGGGGDNIDEQFAGETSAATYYLYDGNDSTYTLIGQAICPAVAATPTPGSGSKTSTSNPSPTAPTSSTPGSKTAGSSTSGALMPIISLPKASSMHTISSSLSFFKFKISWSIFWLIFGIDAAIGILFIISAWMVFRKAGRKGWLALIPFYNYWVVFEIGNYPGWWGILLYIPVINIAALFMYAMACMRIARSFGKTESFGIIGLFFFGFVGWPMLAFGKSAYHRPHLNKPIPEAPPNNHS